MSDTLTTGAKVVRIQMYNVIVWPFQLPPCICPVWKGRLFLGCLSPPEHQGTTKHEGHLPCAHSNLSASLERHQHLFRWAVRLDFKGKWLPSHTFQGVIFHFHQSNRNLRKMETNQMLQINTTYLTWYKSTLVTSVWANLHCFLFLLRL